MTHVCLYLQADNGTPNVKPPPMFRYRATIVDVYDGDTVKADIDLGFGIVKRRETFRLAAINAPEVRGESREAGLVARDALRRKILHAEVELSTMKTRRGSDKRGKYGRYIATVHLGAENVNLWMVSNGFATAYAV